MDQRLKLHEELCKLLNSRNAYFNPPESLKLNFPCIKYSIAAVDQKFANNMTYLATNRYELILIDFEPDSEFIAEIIAKFPMCKFDRSYVVDELYHFVFTLYY